VKRDNFSTGKFGEDLAEEYLRNNNILVIERNFRTRFGEIDIIGYDGKILVFVEVKTKIGHDFGEPEDMVNREKIAKVKRMGEVYMLDNNLDIACRIDVVAIVLDDNKKVESLKHYQAVY